MNLRMIPSALAALLLVAFLPPGASGQAKIVVLSTNAVKSSLEKMLPQAEKATGRKLAVEYSSTGTLRQRIAAGEAFDATILTREAMDDLVKQKKVATGGVDVARGGIGVGIKAGVAKPDIRTGDALKQFLLKAKSVTYTDNGASRPFIDAMLQKMGIAEALKSRTMLEPPGRSPDLVGAGKAEVVITLMSEILPVKGVQLVGPLPPEYQNYVVLAAGASATTKETAAVRALVGFLKSAAAGQVYRDEGLEPR
jgi:molybdate transport system substrate-binding protein